MILSKGVNPSENTGVSSFPSHPVLSLPIPLLSSPFPFPSPSPPSFPFPRRPHPINQLGERCKLPQWGLGEAPADKRLSAYLGQKKLCFVYLSLWAPQTRFIIIVL